MSNRQPANWVAMDDEYTNDCAIWEWGDWILTKEASGYYLLVTSGVSYGPFPTFETAKEHAEHVRGD